MTDEERKIIKRRLSASEDLDFASFMHLVTSLGLSFEFYMNILDQFEAEIAQGNVELLGQAVNPATLHV